jgi:UDP-MurNAc hydroxylase
MALGHAGFMVETNQALVVMDPWLSEGGAYDAAWFQYPPNQHLADPVRRVLTIPDRQRVVYISHEHKDHLDLAYLRTLPTRELKLLIPAFRRTAMLEMLAPLNWQDIVVAKDRQMTVVGDAVLTLLVDDSESNRDSAALVRADGHRFLNFNDCKVYDRVAELGSVDVFACQFSGATWHPTCYEYPPDIARAHGRRKRYGKFQTVARAMAALRPRFYLPSAGPACFLDPSLYHLNLQPDGIFPMADEFLGWLETQRPDLAPLVRILAPGAALDVADGRTTTTAPQDHASALSEYAAANAHRFRRPQESINGLTTRLAEELRDKLTAMTLRCQMTVPLYVGLVERPGHYLRVDFQRGAIESVRAITDAMFYRMTAPGWQVARVLDRAITWEDFSLTFRMRLQRVPDHYDPLLHAFLILEAGELAAFCEHHRTVRGATERVVIEAAGGCRYMVDRRCPHQGGDLSQARIEGLHLICPRHGWRFDLERGGQCLTSEASIHAERL